MSKWAPASSEVHVALAAAQVLGVGSSTRQEPLEEEEEVEEVEEEDGHSTHGEPEPVGHRGAP